MYNPICMSFLGMSNKLTNNTLKVSVSELFITIFLHKIATKGN